MAIALAFAWGLAEATFFFFVPDLLLTLLACRALRPAIKATIAALAGALTGGAIMYVLGSNAPATAEAFLDYIPAISPRLIERVASEIDERGLMAVMLGPIKGIPYKIYAAECGARGKSFIGFLLVSIPARYIRFFISALVARAIARIIEPLTRHRATIEVVILAIVWAAFYSSYFARFGW